MSWEELVRLSEDIASSPRRFHLPFVHFTRSGHDQYCSAMHKYVVQNKKYNVTYQELVRLSEYIASSPLMPEISSDCTFHRNAVQCESYICYIYLHHLACPRLYLIYISHVTHKMILSVQFFALNLC